MSSISHEPENPVDSLHYEALMTVAPPPYESIDFQTTGFEPTPTYFEATAETLGNYVPATRTRSMLQFANGMQIRLPFIPTKKDSKGNRRAPGALVGIWVGAGVGGAVGFVLCGPIGFLLVGGAGAIIGRTIAKLVARRQEKKFLSKHDLSTLKPFEKPTYIRSDRCQDCLSQFQHAFSRNNCGLCGQSFCESHLEKRAYLLYKDETKIRCCDICNSCWDRNVIIPINPDEWNQANISSPQLNQSILNSRLSGTTTSGVTTSSESSTRPL